MNIARVFARKTSATPNDALAFTGPPPRNLLDIDQINISVTFSYDIQKAEQLAEAWRKVGVPVKIGGAALGDKGGVFVPGFYLKKGYVITSRGCSSTKDCWFCSVKSREGDLRELPVTEGNIILDNNILACSDTHIKSVFEMLKNQTKRPVFSGGIEARRLKSWHIDLLREVKTKRLYCAYDNVSDYEPLVQAGKLLRDGGITRKSHTARCYVLCGYMGDTFEKAEKRMRDAWSAGFLPFSMLYRDKSGEAQHEWAKFQRAWTRPQIVYSQLKEGING